MRAAPPSAPVPRGACLERTPDRTRHPAISPEQAPAPATCQPPLGAGTSRSASTTTSRSRSSHRSRCRSDSLGYRYQTATWRRFNPPRGRDSTRHVAEIQTANVAEIQPAAWPRSREHAAAAPHRRTHARAACADLHVHVARAAIRLAELPRRLDGRGRRSDRIRAVEIVWPTQR